MGGQLHQRWQAELGRRQLLGTPHRLPRATPDAIFCVCGIASQTSAAPSYGAPASPRRRCPSRSSPPRDSSCGGGSTRSEGGLRLGQGAGAASCCSARNMSEFASGRTTACLEGTTKPRSNRTTRPPSNGSVSRKSRSWPPPRRHPFQTAAGCGSTHRMDNPGGGRRWC